MKKFVLDFIRRGIMACGLGPIVLVAIYLIFHHQTGMNTLTVQQVCIGIFSLSMLAFIAGGLNAIYQFERLPLMPAILIHGTVLYISYLGTYLLNNWLEWDAVPIFVFSAIFIPGYIVIWVIIYSITRKRTEKLNQLLKHKLQNIEDERCHPCR